MRIAGPIVAAVLVMAAPAPAAVIDDFRDVSAWAAVPADGVEMRLSAEGGALRIDYDFKRGGGWAIARREVDLRLPEHYAFVFRIRGDSPTQTLEFKLVDSSGANVWWRNQRDFDFPRDWKTETIKRRHIQFAWGPAGGGDIRHVAAIEIAITAGSGGKGTVWLDDLELRELSPPAPATQPVARASSARRGHASAWAVDSDSTTAWRSAAGDARPWIELDLGGDREFGGLVIDWEAGRHASDYVVEASDEGRSWRAMRTVRGGDGGRDYHWLPESGTRRLRIRATSRVVTGVGVARLSVQPLDWAPTRNDFILRIARAARRGDYPRAFAGEQSYWTVLGADGEDDEGLLSEDGAIEAGRGSFTIEPFLRLGGRFWTWADVEVRQRWEPGAPPFLTWSTDSLELVVAPIEGKGRGLLTYYRVRNRSPRSAKATLYLAIRPFLVNPPTQFLNAPAGVASIRDVEIRGDRMVVNGEREITFSSTPTSWGVLGIDAGNVVASIRRGRVPVAKSALDDQGFASGVAAFEIELPPKGEHSVSVLTHLPESRRWTAPGLAEGASVAIAPGSVSIELPGEASEIGRTVNAQLQYILINRDGPAIQPGSRAYERSWIRDGSLTSSALLRQGQHDVVREFIDWFAPNQYENGKVPCCVDRRGPDPVPEHDSHGELIYLVAEYLRYTGDRASAERWWPHVLKAAHYMDTLRAQRRTPEYRRAEKREFFGILPPSISHEGYSAKPMHSYWDDFFALRGYKDAAWLARQLEKPSEAGRLERSRREFERDLGASIRAAMSKHRIDFVPGCADLGDFDATSTTIALSPVQVGREVPQAALRRTFERYWEFFVDRRRRDDWDAYTPYELRNVGAFVRLGWRDRAHELLDFFMAHRRPAGWAQWAEVVGREERKPRFLGDMPHTWVGSDFVRSVLDMFAYEREADRSLVIGAGVPLAWLEGGGAVVRGLRTPFGRLDLVMKGDARRIELRIDRVQVPPGGLVIAAPGVTSRWIADVDGRRVGVMPNGELRVRKVPATVTLQAPSL